MTDSSMWTFSAYDDTADVGDVSAHAFRSQRLVTEAMTSTAQSLAIIAGHLPRLCDQIAFLCESTGASADGDGS
jgi:hypothetical protein